MNMRSGSVTTAVLCVTLLCLVCSCQLERTEWGGSAQIDAAGWVQNAPARINLPVEDSLASYRISLLLRHTNRFQYTGLWLQASIYSPDGTRFRCDTLYAELADDRGRWTGRGWGDLYMVDLPWTWGRRYAWFPRCGTYQFSIGQLMPDMQLQGVNDVSVRIVKQRR